MSLPHHGLTFLGFGKTMLCFRWQGDKKVDGKIPNSISWLHTRKCLPMLRTKGLSYVRMVNVLNE